MKIPKKYLILLGCLILPGFVFVSCIDLIEGAREKGRWSPPSECIPLTQNVWSNGNIYSAGQEVWYMFYANAYASENYHSYCVWWNDSKDGDHSKTLDVQVTAYNIYGQVLFNFDSGWIYPGVFEFDSGDYAYIRVAAFNNNSIGSFAIAYNTGLRP